MTTKLEQIFKEKVLNALKPLSLPRMQRTVYQLLAIFDRNYIQSADIQDADDITFRQLGFHDSTPPLASFFPLQDHREWLPYPRNTRKEEWVVLPIRDLTPRERALPALKSLLFTAAAPINPENETLLTDVTSHFHSATANVRAATVGLGYAAVAIPNARRSLSETAVCGQMMKMELVKF